MDAGARATPSASRVRTIAMATGVCPRVTWRLACLWLLMATVLQVACGSVADVTRSASAAVVKRSLLVAVSYVLLLVAF